MIYENDRGHDVYLRHGDGPDDLTRIPKGAHVSLSGRLADGADGIGLPHSSEAKAKAYRKSLLPGEETGSHKSSLEEGLTELQRAAQLVGVAVPLAVVIGDDQAPHGPGSGTITTKEAVAEKSPADRAAFADHEATAVGILPGEDESEAVRVHNEQVRGRQRVEELAHAVLDGSASSAEAVEVANDPEPSGDDGDSGETEAGGEEQPDYDSITKKDATAALKERGVDPKSVKGTGAKGGVTRDDLVDALRATYA